MAFGIGLPTIRHELHAPEVLAFVQLARERGAPDNVSVAIARHSRD